MQACLCLRGCVTQDDSVSVHVCSRGRPWGTGGTTRRTGPGTPQPAAHGTGHHSPGCSQASSSPFPCTASPCSCAQVLSCLNLLGSPPHPSARESPPSSPGVNVPGIGQSPARDKSLLSVQQTTRYLPAPTPTSVSQRQAQALSYTTHLPSLSLPLQVCDLEQAT